jgi:hypothetical protein
LKPREGEAAGHKTLSGKAKRQYKDRPNMASPQPKRRGPPIDRSPKRRG